MGKDTGLFNFKYYRGTDCVKLLLSAYDLSQKPIKYWANVGTVNKKGKFQTIISLVKNITGDRTGNGISHLYYYGGSRVIFPFHLNWMGNSFELTIYNAFGEGNDKFHISRKVSSDNERFTKEDVKKIEEYLCLQYHIVWDGYRFINQYMKEAKNYSDVSAVIRDIKEKLNNKVDSTQ